MTETDDAGDSGFDVILALFDCRTREKREQHIVANSEFLLSDTTHFIMQFMSCASKWKHIPIERYISMLKACRADGIEAYFQAADDEWREKFDKATKLQATLWSAYESTDFSLLAPEYQGLLQDLTFILPWRGPAVTAQLHHARGITFAHVGALNKDAGELLGGILDLELAYTIYKEIGDQERCIAVASTLAQISIDVMRLSSNDNSQQKLAGPLLLGLNKILEKYRQDLDSDHPSAFNLGGKLALIAGFAAMLQGEDAPALPVGQPRNAPASQSVGIMQKFFGLIRVMQKYQNVPKVPEEESHAIIEQVLVPLAESMRDLTPEASLEIWLNGREHLANWDILKGARDNAKATLREGILRGRQHVLSSIDEREREMVLGVISKLTEILTGLCAEDGDIAQAYWTLSRGRTVRASVYNAMSSIENDPALADVMEARSLVSKTRVELADATAEAERFRIELTKSDVATSTPTEEKWAPVVALKARQAELNAQLTTASENFQSLLRSHGVVSSLEPPSLQAMSSAIPPNAVAVMISVGAKEGWMIVVPHGITEFNAARLVKLPELNTTTVDALVGHGDGNIGWLQAYNLFKDRLREPMQANSLGTRDFTAAIDAAGSELWRILIGPLDQTLRDLGYRADGETDLILMPPGRLAILPIHAAWRTDANEVGGRRYSIEDWAISICQSPQALVASADRIKRHDSTSRSVVAVTDPLGDLAQKIGPAFENPGLFSFPAAARRELRGPQATKEAVLHAIAAASHVSFYCHGVWDPAKPNASGLVMSPASSSSEPSTRTWFDVLSYNDLLRSEANISNSRLWVLAACETAAVDLKLPDEFLGIGAGLANQVPGVLSTLFPVDASTTNIAIRTFMKLHTKDGLTPSQALRRVQLSLKKGRQDVVALLDEEARPGDLKNGFSRSSGITVPLILAEADEEEALGATTLAAPPSEVPDDAWTQSYFWAGYQFAGL